MTTTQFFETKEQYLAFRKAFAKAAASKQLLASHFILLNLVRGKPLSRGFTPVTRPSRLENGHSPNYGLYSAASGLQHISSTPRFSNKWHDEMVGIFVKPFGDVFTKEHLLALNFTNPIHLIENFGADKEIIAKLISGEFKTFADIEGAE